MQPLKLNVLLIEDNLDHVDLLAQLFAVADTNPPFALLHEGDMASGLDRLRQGGIDLVLLDLTLPDSEGLESFIRVLEVSPDVAIIVMSGINDVSLAIETVQLGAQDYLVKGMVDNHLLIRAMQYAIERKRVQAQLSRAHSELEVRVQERTAALRLANERLQKEIAERRKAEEEALSSNRQLAEALDALKDTQQQIILRERMHALGRMANGIAHDFNNTLSPIIGFSELMLLKPEVLQDTARVTTYLEKMHAAAKDGARVVSQLRDFYRHRDDTELLTPVVINDIVQQAVSLTQPKWKDDAQAHGVTIQVRTELSPMPSIPGDEAELREAIINIMFNAIEAIPDRGCITLRTKVLEDFVEIAVEDDGAGMSEEVRTRCLEPFYTTRPDNGSGLGLGRVYGIMRRHEGEVDIQSTMGRGTKVTLRLPLGRSKMEPVKMPKPGLVAPIGNSMHILVVEDEPLVREVLSLYLGEDDHKVTMAQNGREALELFEKGTFDLILTDRAMPEMNGDQLAQEIKKRKSDQRVVLLTGYGDMMNSANERPAGVDKIVSKPFTLDSLRQAIADTTVLP